MAYVNPDSILTGTLGAIEMAASAFDRADRRRREQEQEELRQKAGEFVALNMPKFRDGKLVDEPPEVKYNSAEFKNFANSKYVKPYLMQGVPDYIKDVEYTGMAKTGVKEDGSPVFTPTARWLDEDGKEVSHGPITAYRSKDPNDPVAQFTPDDIYNFGAAAIYKADPQLGQLAHRMVMEQSKGGVIAAYRQAATPEDKAAILNSAAKYWNPSEITNAAAGPLRVENLQRGGYDVDDGLGNRTFVPNDEVREKAKKVNLFQNTQEVERQRTLAEGGLVFKEQTAPRQINLDRIQNDASRLAELEFKEKFGDRIREEVEKNQLSQAAAEEKIRAMYFPAILERKVQELKVTADTNADSTLRNIPKTVAAENYKTDKTEEFRRDLNAQDGAQFDQGMALINSSNPADQQKGKQLIQGLTGDPAKADEFIKQKGAVRDLRSALDSNFNGMTPDQVTTLVATNYDKMPRAEQESFQKRLINGIKQGDKNAQAALEATLFPPSGAGSGGGAAPKPAVFKKDELKGYLKNHVPEEVADAAALNGEIKFRRAADTLDGLGLPITKDSVNAAVLNRVTGNEFILQHNGALSDSGVDDAFPALWSWEAVAQETNPNDAEDPAKAQAYVRDVFLPITQELKAAGLPATFQKSHAVSLDVARLQKAGVGEKEAIREAIKLEKDPQYATEVVAAAKRDKKSPYEVVKEWSKKDVRTLRDAELRDKREAARRAGLSTLYPELNPR